MANVYLIKTESKVYCLFKFSLDIIKLIKNCPTYQFDVNEKRWSILHSDIDLLIRMLLENNYTYTITSQETSSNYLLNVLQLSDKIIVNLPVPKYIYRVFAKNREMYSWGKHNNENCWIILPEQHKSLVEVTKLNGITINRTVDNQ